MALALPSGEYRLHVLPAYGTPYLESDSTFNLSDDPPGNIIVASLPSAAQVEIHVVDKGTGKGIEGVDLWRGTPGRGRELHYTTSWEVATRIVHRDRQRTDENGVINALFVPGRHRIGVAWQAFPSGYRPDEADGVEIECEAGRKEKVVFHLVRTSAN